MIRHLLNKPVAGTKKRSKEFRLLAGAVQNLRPISKDSKFGDCLEVNICPEDIRKYIEYPFSAKIRQLGFKTWRIWLMKG